MPYIQTKKRLSISNPILSKSVDIRLSDYPIGALGLEIVVAVNGHIRNKVIARKP